MVNLLQAISWRFLNYRRIFKGYLANSLTGRIFNPTLVACYKIDFCSSHSPDG